MVYLYFIHVSIYTPNKVKSEQREEKRWIRQTIYPADQNPHMTPPVFSFGCKNIGEITAYFRTFATDRKQVDFGRETAVFPLVPIQEKERQNRRF